MKFSMRRRLLVLLCGVVAVYGLVSVILFVKNGAHSVSLLKTHYPLVRYQGPDERPQVVLQKRIPTYWVRIGSISKAAVKAILISEDWAFYQHNGFDLDQIYEALKKDWEEGRFARGASTITQQVAKNVFLENEKSLSRKFKELFLAIQLEQKIHKQRILEIYLNIAEWGEGIFGIGKAAEVYFKKTPSQLTVKEGAFLAMLLPSPKRYSQSFRDRKLTPYAQSTVRSILEKLEVVHFINEEEMKAALGEPLSFESP